MADTEALMRLVDEHAQAYHQHRVLMDSAPFDKQRAQESLSRLHKAAEAIRTHAAGVQLSDSDCPLGIGWQGEVCFCSAGTCAKCRATNGVVRSAGQS